MYAPRVKFIEKWVDYKKSPANKLGTKIISGVILVFSTFCVAMYCRTSPEENEAFKEELKQRFMIREQLSDPAFMHLVSRWQSQDIRELFAKIEKQKQEKLEAENKIAIPSPPDPAVA